MSRKPREKSLTKRVAEITSSFEKQVSDAEANKLLSKPGSKTYLDYCRGIVDLRMRQIAALQSIGFLPKNIGNSTTERYEFTAVCRKDGSVETRPVDMFDEKDFKDLK